MVGGWDESRPRCVPRGSRSGVAEEAKGRRTREGFRVELSFGEVSGAIPGGIGGGLVEMGNL